jgi:putative chitinase
MRIDRKRFFDGYRREFKRLSQSQVVAIEQLLDFLHDEENVNDIRHVSYILATIKHETADTFLPIEEYGKGKGRTYGKKDPATGQAYYGRGYVQLTWKRNYQLLGKEFGVDLVNKPSLALKPEIAWSITTHGMSEGVFTGKKLSDYISGAKCDYVSARKIINGTDRARLIADYAEDFERILRAAHSPRLSDGVKEVLKPEQPAPESLSADLPAVAVPADVAAPVAEPVASQQTNESGASGQQVVVNPAPETTPVVKSPFDGLTELASTGMGKIGQKITWGTITSGGATAVWAAFQQNWIAILIGFVFALFLIGIGAAIFALAYNWAQKKKVKEAEIRANPALYNVKL